MLATSEAATCSAVSITSRNFGESAMTVWARWRSRLCFDACASSWSPRTAERAVHQRHQLGLVDRLREEVERAELHRAHRLADLAERGHHDDHAALEALAIGLVEVEAVAVGQAEIEQDDVGLAALEVGDRRGEVGRREHRVAGALQLLLERPAQELLVFDEQDQGHRSVRHLLRVGRGGGTRCVGSDDLRPLGSAPREE